MDMADGLLLLLAGVTAGGMNAVAGGGTLITFPTLIAIGLPPVVANVTNSIAVWPGYLSSVWGSRADLAGQRNLIWAVLPVGIFGGLVGCVLLLATPARAFDMTVPFLILVAAAALALQPRLRQLVGRYQDLSPRRPTAAVQTVIFAGSVYGGYFGAALGVMLVAALGVVMDETLNRINSLKNVVSAVVGAVTVGVFAVFGPVDWIAVLTLAPAATIGGYLGAHLARRMPQRILRAVVVTLGIAVGVVLLMRAFS